MSKHHAIFAGIAPVVPTYDDPVDVPSSFANYANSQNGPGVYVNAVNKFSSTDKDGYIFNSYAQQGTNSALRHALGTRLYSAYSDTIVKPYTTGWRDRVEWKNDGLQGTSGNRAPGLIGFVDYYRPDPNDYNNRVYRKWSVRGTEWLNNATTGTAYPHQGDNLNSLQLGRLNSKWVRFEIEYFTMPWRYGDGAYNDTETIMYFRATGQTWDGGSNYRHYIIHGKGDTAVDAYTSSSSYEAHETAQAPGATKDFVSWTRDWRIIHTNRG